MIEPDESPVHLSVGDLWILPVATATDNVDGEINNIEIDTTLIDIFYNEYLNKYEFTQEGIYEVDYFVSDEAGNSTTFNHCYHCKRYTYIFGLL